jgi:hypothetical protein
MKIGTRVFKGEELETRLCAMLDYILSDPVMEQASLSAGFNRKYIWTALKRSGSGDPRYLVRWPDRDSDDERIQFVDAVLLARNMWRIRFDGNLRSAVDTGIPRTVLDQNHEVVYEKDPELLALYGGDTEAARQRADDDFIFDYPYRHRLNEKGNFERVPLVVYDAAPGSLRLHASRSLLPDWNPSEHRTTTTSHSGAVLILGGNPSREAADSPQRLTLQQRIADLRGNVQPTPAPRTVAPADAPKQQPPEPPPVNLKRMSGGERVGAGKPPPGGFSATTGKPT